MTHCDVGELTVWLLGSSDKRMHIYNEDKSNDTYQEVESGDILLEFCNSFPCGPTWWCRGTTG